MHLETEEERVLMEPKYQMIADSLKREIESGVYSEKMLLPTEQLLCRRFQISRQTARRALSVLEEDGLIVRRQGSGSHLCQGKEREADLHYSVAVVTTYISDYIFPSILRAVEGVLSANNSAPLLFATRNQVSTERKVLQTLLSMKELDGVLVEGTKTALPNPNLDLYRALMDRGVRLVFINGAYPELSETVCVLDDNRCGGRQLVEYLSGKGHRGIAGIFKIDDMQGLQRYAGYTQALRELGRPVEDDRVLWYNTESKESIFTNGSVGRWLDGLEGVTAVVCYNDEIAVRLVAWLLERGMRVPEGMAVVSFDNSYLSQVGPVPITSLGHRNLLGRVAAEQLLALLAGAPAYSQSLDWELVVRSSG